MPKKEDETLVS